jgi:hypothetical protein
VIDGESRFAESAQVDGACRFPNRRPAALRRARTSIALAAAAAGLLAFAASPALAVDPGHAFSFAFTGSGTNLLSSGATGGDVDNSSGPSKGDLYVSDTTRHRVEKFAPNGEFLLMFGDEVNKTTGGDICPIEPADECKEGKTGTAADQLATPTYLAVDNSNGPSKGDIYVLDTGSKNIHKYAPSGALVTEFGSGGKLDGAAFGEGGFTGTMMGIDVDSKGVIYVANTANPLKYWKINEDATPAGLVTWEAPSVASGFTGGFAVDQNGNTFKANSNGAIARSTPAGNAPVRITSETLSGRWGVDPVSGTLYGAIFPGSTFNEYKFDKVGQPLLGDGTPCLVPLQTNNAGGCPATHSFIASNILSSVRAVAINSFTGNLYVVDGGKSRVAVYIPGQVPLVTTGEPVGNTKVSGDVKLDGAGTISECRFEYGTNTSYNKEVPCEPGTPYAADKSVTAVLTGMTNEVTNHYRIKAKGSNGFNFGADKTILPHNVPRLKTEPADEITRSSARLNASFEGPSEETKYFFEYGTTAGYGSRFPLSPEEEEAGSILEGETKKISVALSGLAYGQLYHFRVVAKNKVGTSKGLDATFETLPAVPNLKAEPATNITPHHATLNASFEGNGEPTTYYYEYGTNTAYTGGKSSEFNAGEPVGPMSLEPFDIPEDPEEELELETIYHYRVVATNPVGTTKSSDMTFKTLPAVAGLLAIAPSEEEITQEAITLHGQFTGNGDPTQYYFEWGLTTSYGHKDEIASAGAPVGTEPLSTVISDFEAYSLYHFRVVAINSEGETKSADNTFETLPAPLPTIAGTAATEVSPTSATLEAQINPKRWATIFLFEYGFTPAYEEQTDSSLPIGSDQFAHPVSSPISNLIPGATYHYRAVAINFTGTTYGPDQVFVTPGPPKVELSSSSGVGQTAATLNASVNPNSAATTVQFEYGTTTHYGTTTAGAAAGSDDGSHQIAVVVGGLQPATAYHFRVVASNPYGTTNGGDQTFTTQPPTKQKTEEPKRQVTCKKGFVKKHGKCVKKKKKKKKKKQKRHSTRGHG